MPTTDFVDSIQAGTLQTLDLPLQAGVAIDVIVAPEDALAAHIGQGVVVFTWTPPSMGSIRRYELFVSTSENGTYTKWGQFTSREKSGIAYNLPVATTLYMKLRAVSTGNTNSDFALVYQGEIEKRSIPVIIRSIFGSTIPANARFAVHSRNSNSLVSLQADSQILIGN